MIRLEQGMGEPPVFFFFGLTFELFQDLKAKTHHKEDGLSLHFVFVAQFLEILVKVHIFLDSANPFLLIHIPNRFWRGLHRFPPSVFNYALAVYNVCIVDNAKLLAVLWQLDQIYSEACRGYIFFFGIFTWRQQQAFLSVWNLTSHRFRLCSRVVAARWHHLSCPLEFPLAWFQLNLLMTNSYEDIWFDYGFLLKRQPLEAVLGDRGCILFGSGFILRELTLAFLSGELLLTAFRWFQWARAIFDRKALLLRLGVIDLAGPGKNFLILLLRFFLRLKLFLPLALQLFKPQLKVFLLTVCRQRIIASQ